MTLVLAIPLIMLGGSLGAICRFLVQGFIASATRLPGWCGILAVNLLGSFLIGLSVAWISGDLSALRASSLSPASIAIETIELGELLAFTAVGFCGAFTTFSSFSLDSFFLAIENRWHLAINLLCSVLGCYLAAVGGWALGSLVAA